jgi:Cu/Ag efflux protein CusF
MPASGTQATHSTTGVVKKIDAKTGVVMLKQVVSEACA